MDIASVRKSLNLTQAEFAKELGVSHAYVGHIEQGVRKPSLKLAARIERLSGVGGIVEAVVADKLASETGAP